ncbi:MAG: spondin domain-containing protein [Woeseiaceae bacterium]|nr:spondin domain-containing protein [Woeseiaceae bacterium]
MKRMLAVVLVALLGATPAFADGNGKRMYDVTITNITSGQTFTPLLVVSHRRNISLFELGEPASEGLATIAESGNIDPLRNALDDLDNKVLDTATNGGLLGPGESVTVRIAGNSRFDRVSVAGMLIPTNDTFVALDSAYLSRRTRTHTVPAYDAGSEHNDELCANIPGPVCMGAGPSEEDGEGYVHISSGIHGIGDLEAAAYDWRNPVAKISVRQARR